MKTSEKIDGPRVGIAADYATGEKIFGDPSGKDLPKVYYEITLGRDGKATIRIEETFPGDIEISDIGYHPEYRKESWRKEPEEGRIVFELTREFEEGETIDTMYALRDFASYDVEKREILEPVNVEVEWEQDHASGGTETEEADHEIVEEVETDDVDSSSDSELSAETIRNLDYGDTGGSGNVGTAEVPPDEEEDVDVVSPVNDEVVPKGGESADETTDGGNETTDEADDLIVEAEDPGTTATTPGETREQSDGGDSRESQSDAGKAEISTQLTAEGSKDDPVAETADREILERRDVDDSWFRNDSVVAKLATELKQGTLSPETEQVFAEVIERVLADYNDSQSNSLEVRVRYMQRRLLSLESYIDALEAFLNESGTAQELIKTTRESINNIEGQLDEVESVLRDHNERMDQFDTTLDELETEVRGFENQIETVFDELSAAESEREEIKGRVQGFDQQISAANDQAKDAKQKARSIEEQVSGVETTIDDVKSDVDELQGDLNQVNGQVDVVEQTSSEAVALANDNSEKVDEIDQKVSELVDGLAEIRSNVQTLDETTSRAATTDDLSELTARVEEIEEELSRVESEIEEETIEQTDTATPDPAIQSEVEALSQRVDKLENTVSKIGNSAASSERMKDELSSITDRLDEVEAAVEPQDARKVPVHTRDDTEDDRYETIESRVDEIAGSVNALVDEVQKIRDALADDDGEIPDLQNMEERIETVMGPVMDSVNELETEVAALQNGHQQLSRN